jgi:hypothetical protein
MIGGRICRYKHKVMRAGLVCDSDRRSQYVSIRLDRVPHALRSFGFIDVEQKTPQPLDNAFGAGLLPMS